MPLYPPLPPLPGQSFMKPYICLNLLTHPHLFFHDLEIVRPQTNEADKNVAKEIQEDLCILEQGETEKGKKADMCNTQERLERKYLLYVYTRAIKLPFARPRV